MISQSIYAQAEEYNQSYRAAHQLSAHRQEILAKEQKEGSNTTFSKARAMNARFPGGSSELQIKNAYRLSPKIRGTEKKFVNENFLINYTS